MKRFLTLLPLLLVATLPLRAATVTFREGETGYAGTRDTYLEQNSPSTSFGGAMALRWDGDFPTGTGLDDLVLLRFDGIVGVAPGQIPPGAVVNSATLTYTIANTGDAGELHEALVDWTESSTLASYCGAACGATQIGPLVGTAPGGILTTQTVNVTSSVQGWVDAAPNRGWIFVPVGIDGVEILSRENAASGSRPLLTVTFGETSATVLRQPYLQQGTPDSMTVVWRTDLPTDSRVRYGKVLGVLDHAVEVAGAVTDHLVTLTGLSPATRYYYDVGSTTQAQAGGTAEHYFDTSPPVGSASTFRVWVVGDSGTGDLAQAQVRDGMLAATGAHRPDLFLHMGDIAYTTGTEAEFTANHFTPYQDILRHTVLWTTLGNHEGMSTVSGAPGPSIGPYYEAFVLPSAGEAGGEPSGTEAYYSFDYANVHFVSLNSYQVDRSATGAMAMWLKADLAATRQEWLVAFWHHPPYTHGTHDSDFEIEHVEMRENLLPILEAGGVDLVLGGHSHSYERSFLIDGTYASPTPDRQTLLEQGHVLDLGDGKPSGNGSYRKSPGINPHEGAVYVVAGHGGADLGGALDHPVMYYSEAIHGSVLMDVQGDRILLTNIRSTGVASDTCTILKAPPVTPVVEATDPPDGATVTSLATFEVTFSTGVTGVVASDLTVAGVPAASVLIEAPDRYLFFLAAPPPPGPASVVLAPGGIHHNTSPSLAFAGDSFSVTLQCTPDDVTNLRWSADRTTLVWDDTAGIATGGRYDVARGGELPTGAGMAACLGADLAGTSTMDAAVPGAGSASWYLVRGSTACSPGTWGHEGDHGTPAAERAVSVCP